MTSITKSAALLIVLSASLIGCADKSLTIPRLSQAQNTTPQATTSATATPIPKSTVKPIPAPQSTPCSECDTEANNSSRANCNTKASSDRQLF